MQNLATPPRLALAGVSIALIPRVNRLTYTNTKAIYAYGNVQATLAATSRPVAGASWPGLRGFPIFILHRLIKVSFLSRFSIHVGPENANLACLAVLNVAIEMLLSNLKVANVHAILTEPSRVQIPFTRRVLSWAMWKKNFSAALLYSTASSICFYLAVHMFLLFSTFNGDDSNSYRLVMIGIALAVMVVLYFVAVVPSYAVFIRVAASTVEYRDSRSIEKTEGVKGTWGSFHWLDFRRFSGILAQVLGLEMIVATCLSLLIVSLLTFEEYPLNLDMQDTAVRFIIRYAC
ncbi:hypothetical protein N7466_011362 [Penicillium verhagenii]|uniref:uncharacterized protein n=1 Tax=Penicillium verhagenii TaxID=1562060 RepID=UPI002544D79E|nr:uncharacterized protein N7466_011362 [Penicillium verhagenii]KAJ5915429.1 hypothetical protein N7466_011362 [Penicillium verhagenii]